MLPRLSSLSMGFSAAGNAMNYPVCRPCSVSSLPSSEGEYKMADAVEFAAGGYRFIPGVFQYSGGAASLPGHDIQRVRFRRPVPLKQGFERIERLITEAGRPLTSFCACELRSPAPFTEQGFRAFNEIYVVTLEKWGLFGNRVNPVARSNVCPDIDPPPEPSFHAFSFTVAASKSTLPNPYPRAG